MIIFLGNGFSLDMYQHLIENSKKDDVDIVLSVQYPHKIPDSLIKSHICVNVHYGKLPQYAGCNPIYWQLLLDDTAGATLHYVENRFDAGDIIEMYEAPCGNSTAKELYYQLAVAGREMFMRHYKNILNGTAPRRKQDLSKRQYFNKTDVNFERVKHITSLEDRQLRALNFPGKQVPIIKVGDRQYKVEAIQ